MKEPNRRDRADRRTSAPSPTSRLSWPDFRRSGGDRDRERAAVRRGAGAHPRAVRGAGAADRDLARCCGVISSSPGELEPVFQTMLANATRICEANFGVCFVRDGEVFAPLRCTAYRRPMPSSGDADHATSGIRERLGRVMRDAAAGPCRRRHGRPSLRRGRTELVIASSIWWLPDASRRSDAQGK